ncbi:MAG TPA: XDD4 family exosortase-dependent surface protein, partial [Fimbriimonas sp.]|nr:XDD4 family exosortase-dependent surface protein [Fimbriimonas sp.]
MKKLNLLSLVAIAAALPSASQALTFSWSGPSNDTGNTLSASASFTSVGNSLVIVLTNTSTGVSSSPADTLGTLAWNLPGSVVTNSLVNNVALTSGGSVKQANSVYGSSYNLNQEYMYNDAVTIGGNSFAHGVSSVGLGEFGTNSDTFYERLRGQGNAGSSQADRFSISSAAGTSGAANNFPVVNNSLTFTLLFNGQV